MYARIGGVRAPRQKTLGSDIAGRVVAVGSGVTRFRSGDEVYGDNLGLMGGFAEYAVAPESVLARKPEALTFAQASTLPQSGAIALQGTAKVGSGAADLDQWRGWWHGFVCDPGRKTHRGARDRSGQCHQARIHAETRCRPGDRLSSPRLHPGRWVRLGARSRCPPIRLCPSKGGGSRRSIPVCGRNREVALAGGDHRCSSRSVDRSPAWSPHREAGACPFPAPGRAAVFQARSTFISTAHFASTRCPRLWLMSGRGAPSARWLSNSLEESSWSNC